MVKNYYTILGLSKGCREDEIKKAYKKLAKQYHPDKNSDQNAEEMFKDVDKAYKILMDKRTREIYDMHGEEGLKRAAKAKAWASTPKFEYPLYVTSEELAQGCIRKMKISRNVAESDEKKRIEIKIIHVTVQKGSKPGTRLIFQREGDRLPDKVPGDIIFIIKIKPGSMNPLPPHPHRQPPSSHAHWRPPPPPPHAQRPPPSSYAHWRPPPPRPHPQRPPPFCRRKPMNGNRATGHQQEMQQKSSPPPAKTYEPDEFLVDKLLRERSASASSSTPEPEPKNNTTDSPFNSAKSFEEVQLRAELKKGVYAMDFDALSKIQETLLFLFLKEPRQGIIAQAQSGTGKTAALVIAMLNRVRVELNYPQVLCLCPSSELAFQIGKMVEEMGQFIPGIKVGYAVSLELGVSKATLTEQVLIGTPGKVRDLVSDRRSFDLSKINLFCLDEADILLSTQGYRDQSIKIHRKLDKNCQKIMFATTYNSEVKQFADKLIPKATFITLKREEESLENIKQLYISCQTAEDKYQAIATIYGLITIGKSIIFCQTRIDATFLVSRLARDSHSVGLVHEELEERQKIAILDGFREGRAKILVLTNAVQIRGMDFEQVTIVFNFDLPTDLNNQVDCESYLHRIGRTGRFGRMGIAINLVNPEAMENLSKIQNYFKKRIYKLDIDDIDEVEKLENCV